MLNNNTILIDKKGESSTPFPFLGNFQNIAGTEALQNQVQLLYGSNIKVIVMQGYTEAIELREISLPEAKKEIMDFVKKKGKAFYSEISDTLRLDIELVVEACDELENEKQIKGTQDERSPK